MLRIKRVWEYNVAKYPRREYCTPPVAADALLRRGAASLVMLALLESCDSGVGTTGPPPVTPDMVTENEARAIIDRVFDENGIVLEEDFRMLFHYGQGDSVELVLDGFNDSLEVGYEYLYRDDYDTFNADVLQALDSNLKGDGPYVGTIDQTSYESIIEDAVEEFIDTLQANGII